MTTNTTTMRTDKTASLVALAGALMLGGPADAEDREWIVAPYLWGADTSLDVLVRNDPVFGGDLDFSDLVDKLELALQLHVETRRDSFGLLFDVTYLETSDALGIDATPVLPASTTVSTGADMMMLEIGGFYRASGKAFGLDLLLGVRTIDLDVDVEIVPPTPLNPLGVKGAGETGTCGALPAVMSAVNDGLASIGAPEIDMPATPEKVWRAIDSAPKTPVAA